jgi:hypothetical protein
MTNVFKVGTSNPSLHMEYVAIKIFLEAQNSVLCDDFTFCDRIHAVSRTASDSPSRRSLQCWTRSDNTRT